MGILHVPSTALHGLEAGLRVLLLWILIHLHAGVARLAGAKTDIATLRRLFGPLGWRFVFSTRGCINLAQRATFPIIHVSLFFFIFWFRCYPFSAFRIGVDVDRRREGDPVRCVGDFGLLRGSRRGLDEPSGDFRRIAEGEDSASF
jgi:hypothetical protein